MTIVADGSINLGIVDRVDHLPRGGETIAALDTVRLPGRKGANQAIAAALPGADLAMNGLVGNDSDGRFTIERRSAAGRGLLPARAETSLNQGADRNAA